MFSTCINLSSYVSVSLDILNIVFSVVYGFYHAIANYSTALWVQRP